MVLILGMRALIEPGELAWLFFIEEVMVRIDPFQNPIEPHSISWVEKV